MYNILIFGPGLYGQSFTQHCKIKQQQLGTLPLSSVMHPQMVPETEKDDFYNMLNSAYAKTPKYDVIIVMGDLNAKVGTDNTDSDEIMGKHWMGTINANGEKLLETCRVNNLVIGGSVF